MIWFKRKNLLVCRCDKLDDFISKGYLDLANVYALIKPLKFGLAVLVKEFENHVKKIALEFVQNLKGDQVTNTVL